MEYAVKYQNIKIDEETNLFIPLEIIKGHVKEDTFTTNKYTYKYITTSNINCKYLVGPSFTMDYIRDFYALPADKLSNKDVIELVLTEAKDCVVVYKNGKFVFLDLSTLSTPNKKVELYQIIDGETCLMLNQDSVNELLTTDEISKLKEKLKFMRDKICKFSSFAENKGLELLELHDGVTSRIYTAEVFDDTKDEEESKEEELAEEELTEELNIQEETLYTNEQPKTSALQNFITSTNETSVEGLYKYLKSNIIGHDEALKKIATILYMNYTSSPLFGTESILIPGPTGTGKTATFNCAAKYFDVPFRNINTCNLVPEGIVGTTLEDEFDKIGVDKLDTKTSLVNIFLKALEGEDSQMQDK